MLKLCRVTKVKVLFLVLVYVFNFNLFEFSAAILEKCLLVTQPYPEKRNASFSNRHLLMAKRKSYRKVIGTTPVTRT